MTRQTRPRLTRNMLETMLAVLNEAEAGGWIAHTQTLTEKEAAAFVREAEKAMLWISAELGKRAPEAK